MNTGDSTVLKRFGVWDDLRRTICTLAELVNLKKKKKNQTSLDGRTLHRGTKQSTKRK